VANGITDAVGSGQRKASLFWMFFSERWNFLIFYERILMGNLFFCAAM
jgi:hypothetical protein